MSLVGVCERKKRSDVPILQICIPGVYCIAFVCTKGNFFAVLLCFASRRGGGGWLCDYGCDSYGACHLESTSSFTRSAVLTQALWRGSDWRGERERERKGDLEEGRRVGGKRKEMSPAEGVKDGMVEREQEAKQVEKESEKNQRGDKQRERERSSQDKWQWLDNVTAHTVLETLITRECFSTLWLHYKRKNKSIVFCTLAPPSGSSQPCIHLQTSAYYVFMRL